MLQDEQAAGSQDAPLACGPDDLPGERSAIGRIGEYDVHRAGMVGEVTQTPDGVCHPDPALSIRTAPVTRTLSGMLALLDMPVLPPRLTTESTAIQVVPDHPYSTPVMVDKQTAARAPAQGFNTQNPAAGTQIQHGAVCDSGRKDVKQ